MTDVIEDCLGEVRRAVPGLDTDPAVNCSWVSGSLTANLGTPTSDIDITVIVNPGIERGAGDSEVRSGQYLVQKRRVDVEVRSLTWLEELKSAVRAYSVTAADSSQLFTDESILKAVAQLRSGIRIINDSASFSATRAALAGNEIEFRRLLISRSAMYANNTQEDLVGFILDGDHDSALIRGRDLLMFGLDAWATVRGELYPGGKWIWRRLQRVVTDSGTLRVIRELVLPGPRTSPLPYLYRLNTVNQTLLAQALLLSWSTDPRRVVEPVLPDLSACGLWRGPYWTPNRLADHWYLTDRREGLSVPFTAVLCWALAGGLARAELVAEVVGRSADWFDTRVSAATIESLIDELVKRGALAEGSLDSLADAHHVRIG